MRILIVDSKPYNIEVAKKAAKDFSEIKFEFLSSASQALKEISNTDGIITGFFFPPEPEEKEELASEYHFYINLATNSSLFTKVVNECYSGNWEIAKLKLNEAIQVMKSGTIRTPLLRVIGVLEARGDDATDHRHLLDTLPAPQFSYGGVIILRAKAEDKKHVLLTNLRIQATTYEDHYTSVDGICMLLPLIEKGIVTIEEVKLGGVRSTTYIGEQELVGMTKQNPNSWTKAIRKLTSQ